jgi:hypothetical protein
MNWREWLGSRVAPGAIVIEPEPPFAGLFEDRIGKLGLTGVWVESERADTDARQRYRTRAYRIEATPSESFTENFLRCIRTREKPVLDGEFGYRVQVAVSLGAMAFRYNRVTFFDPVQEKVVDASRPQWSADDRTTPIGRRREDLQPGIALRIANIPASAARQAGQRRR